MQCNHQNLQSSERKNGFVCTGAGFGKFTAQQETPQTIIIRKKKRLARFERRFLSSCGKSENCVLEVAVMWRDTVLRIDQIEAKAGRTITAGPDTRCDIQVDTGDNNGALTLLRCNSQGRWEFVFHNGLEGFLLLGDKKEAFSTASSANYPMAYGEGLHCGSLSCPVQGSTRAKFIFGEVSVLVHYVDRMAYAKGMRRLGGIGALAASLLIHFALFSVVLFATNRVDALMIDRVMTNARFAKIVEVDEPKVDEPDPIEPDEIEVADDTPDVVEVHHVDNAVASNHSSSNAGSGATMSKSAAQAKANQSGLLNQRNAMTSMLASVNMMNMDVMDNWAHFDPNAAAASTSYGITASGTRGGGQNMNGFSADLGNCPGGVCSGNSQITAGAKGFDPKLGPHIERKIELVGVGKPEVTGISQRIIQKVVRDHKGELRACYERELTKNKDLGGRVVFVWMISPQGVVTKAIVKESTLHNSTVEACIKNSIQHWRFPMPQGSGIAQIEYPFTFNPSK